MNHEDQKEQHAALDRLLAVDQDQPPRPGFDTRFFARLEEHKRKRGRRGFGLAWRLAVGGAVVAMSAVLAWVGPLGDGNADPVGQELALVMDLPLLEDMDVVRDLEVLEAFEVLAMADVDGGTP